MIGTVKTKFQSMWGKVDKKSTEIFFVHLVLALSGLWASFWYAYKSFYGLLNPYFYFTALVFDSLLKKPGFFPKDIYGVQAMWEQPFQDLLMPMQTFIIGGIMLFLGIATLLTCFQITNEIQEFLLKAYVKLRFGSVYYSVWIYTQKKRWLKKTEKERKLDPLRKAEHEHYEQWKKYNKSALTFSEWKQKVLNYEKD
ncbi:hypothetical protein [Acinetobacter variabilis]|uniref:hypothetical protein n=1 Tax=Acinetobacter variabilis TaxID=70346 RepID=UPI0028A5AF6D|nr:hypothetical protein [Acinetobacter variabilis]